MPRKVYARISLVLVLLFIGIGLVYSLITTSTTKQYLQQISQHFNRDLARRIVADRNLVAEGLINKNELQKTFSDYMDINPSIEIYLLDMEGQILSFSADPGKVKRQQVDLKPIFSFLAGKHFPLLGDDPRSHDRRKAFSVTPVPSGLKPEGYLYVVLQGEEYDNAEQAITESYVLKLSAWAVAGSLGFGLFAGLLLFHLLTQRLRTLSTKIQAFQTSDLHLTNPQSRQVHPQHDEIAQLGYAFDGMAERITGQFEQLQNQDQLRRELIAQVSHDLRTPLAVLHGYLETLQMKGTDLNTDSSEQYLRIALKQSHRVKGMIEELFELAHLEARDTKPLLEPCSIAELLQDITQKFQLRAAENNIKLTLQPVMENLPMALADIQLTERLLDNLISNALDHTPDNGDIWLSVILHKKKLEITLTDNGNGIPEQDLPHIFEPFYRGRERSRSGGHAGLGLAIAQRICRLQGSQLTVSNCQNVGACFKFKLDIVSHRK